MIWLNYVVLAGDLVVLDSEAAKRSGVSCAYYGAFNYARRWLEARGTSIQRHRVHAQVWGSFRDADPTASADKERCQAVGELGGSLRLLRIEADYGDTMPELDGRAIDSVAIARRIIGLIDELELS
jgi:hypothetical protein